MRAAFGMAVVSPHAARQMERRGIAVAVVREVLDAPEQLIPARAGRVALHRRFVFDGTLWLVRVIVDIDRFPPEIVTVYRTTRIAKYWRVTQ